MANTERQKGDYLQIVAGGTLTSGTPVKAGTALFGVPQTDAASGEVVALAVKGVHAMPKVGGAAAYAVGDKVYWNAASSKVTKTATDDYIGVCTKAALIGDTEVEVRISGEVKEAVDADAVQAAGAVMDSEFVHASVSWGGGGASYSAAKPATFDNDKPVFAIIEASTNGVAIHKAICTGGNLTITLSGDPGAATVFKCWQDKR